MIESTISAKDQHEPAADGVEMGRDLSARQIAPIVRKIDAEGYYPESVLRAFGRAGAFARHLPGQTPGGPDLVGAIRAMAAAGEYCLPTPFCMCCPNAPRWYLFAPPTEPPQPSL